MVEYLWLSMSGKFEVIQCYKRSKVTRCRNEQGRNWSKRGNYCLSTEGLLVNYFIRQFHLLVCLSVCLCVCLPLFSDMLRPRGLVFCTIVGYRSETKPIDFGVNGYIFKVKVMKIWLLSFPPTAQVYGEISSLFFFNITEHGRGQYVVKTMWPWIKVKVM